MWVLNPIDNTYLKAAAVDPAMKGMTAVSVAGLQAGHPRAIRPAGSLLSLAAGRNAIRDVMEEALQAPSGKRRVRAARFLQPPPSQPVNGACWNRPILGGRPVHHRSIGDRLTTEPANRCRPASRSPSRKPLAPHGRPGRDRR